LLPELVWDAPDIASRELFAGCASGSAQPLVWAHAEYLKLRRSIQEGRVFDQPPQTVARYVSGAKRTTPYAVWRFNQKIRTMKAGRILRVETLARAAVVWGVNAWQQVQEQHTIDTGFGVYVADLATAPLPSGASVELTFFWVDEERWEQTDFRVAVIGAEHHFSASARSSMKFEDLTSSGSCQSPGIKHDEFKRLEELSLASPEFLQLMGCFGARKSRSDAASTPDGGQPFLLRSAVQEPMEEPSADIA
jgi:hypothetical protein